MLVDQRNAVAQHQQRQSAVPSRNTNNGEGEVYSDLNEFIGFTIEALMV